MTRVIFFFICGGLVLGCDRGRDSPKVPSINGYAKQEVLLFDLKPNSSGDSSTYILTRMESLTDNVILMAHYAATGRSMAGIPPDWRDTPPDWPQVAYRFDPEAWSVEEVTAAEWDAAKGPVHKRPYTEASCHGAVNQEILKSAGRRKAGHGQYAVTCDCDRSGALIALLSADGPNPAISIPFLGGGKGYRGQHYHEVLTYADLSPVGKPVPIPLKWSVDATVMAWSPDSRYVIYRYENRPDAVIVRVPEREGVKP